MSLSILIIAFLHRPYEVEVWPYATGTTPPVGISSIASGTGATPPTGSNASATQASDVGTSASDEGNNASYPIVAVAYITPPERLIQTGLPPLAR
jgi:hypothetical protein